MSMLFTVHAMALDLHLLWEDHCTQCHDETGDFARKFLVESGGKLYGSQPDRDICVFLRNHYLVDEEADRVYAMLLAQATSGARFKKRCSTCHPKAAELVRDVLVREDGEPVVAKTKQPVKELLPGHDGIQGDDDLKFFLDLLNRIDREIRRP